MSDATIGLRRDPKRIAPALGVLTDERLARLAAKGSTSAFATIYRRHHQAIYRYCLSIVGNEHDARDALQETMASALRALDGEEREISLRPWLFRIAHNEAITVLRKRQRESPVEEIRLGSYDGGVEASGDLRQLLDDLGLLTTRQRSALVMRELSGLSFEEIGAALDVSPVGAKQAVYEARCALRDLREGRLLDCAEVRTKISAEDRRLLRARRVRAHLRSCDDCSEFEEEIRARRQRLAAIAPLPAPAALGILQALIGGGTSGGAIALGAGASLAGLTKLGVAGLVAVGVGAGALEARDQRDADASKPAPQERVVAEPQATESTPLAEGWRDLVATPAATPPDKATSAQKHRGNGEGPASAPPGHGGTPPGQGGTPPGLGAPPPGQGGTPPGQEVTPPGQSGTAPGQSGGAPGQSDASAGQSASAPGQTGQTPASGASPPGQAK